MYQLLNNESWTRNLINYTMLAVEIKGYRLLVEKTSKVIIRRDIIRFNETDFGYTETVKSKETVEIDIDLEKANVIGKN